jgi:hypothetical protein
LRLINASGARRIKIRRKKMVDRAKRQTKVKVKNLPRQKRELSKKEQKQVKGGMNVSMNASVGGATLSAAIDADLETNPEAQAQRTRR